MWLCISLTLSKFDEIRSGLIQERQSCRLIFDCDLKPNTADQIGNLPFETNKIFVIEICLNAAGLQERPGNDCFREISVTPNSC